MPNAPALIGLAGRSLTRRIVASWVSAVAPVGWTNSHVATLARASGPAARTHRRIAAQVAREPSSRSDRVWVETRGRERSSCS